MISEATESLQFFPSRVSILPPAARRHVEAARAVDDVCAIPIGEISMAKARQITPCLWFDNRIEEAVKFYVSVFGDGEILSTSYYGEGAPQPKGTVMVIMFRLGAQKFMALNGGPLFKFTEAVSFMVDCDNQAEVDHFWNALTADGGEESQCGWLKDKYGLSWQITPTALLRYVQDKDPARAQRAMAAMMTMRKIDIAAIERAHAG
jgi:predicted 3-demethylubiquinone-9 3-methyltransferase (glyoxalase superfamily)